MGSSDKKAEILRLIEREFAKFRNKNPDKKIGYPANLKILINSDEARVLSALEVSKAAKITPKSVRNWQDGFGYKSKRLMPRELRLVADSGARERSTVGSSEKRHDARVTLSNGVAIELPVTELSTELLTKLCGLELANAD